MKCSLSQFFFVTWFVVVVVDEYETEGLYIKEKSYKKGNRIYKGQFLGLSAPVAINVHNIFCES